MISGDWGSPPFNLVLVDVAWIRLSPSPSIKMTMNISGVFALQNSTNNLSTMLKILLTSSWSGPQSWRGSGRYFVLVPSRQIHKYNHGKMQHCDLLPDMRSSHWTIQISLNPVFLDSLSIIKPLRCLQALQYRYIKLSIWCVVLQMVSRKRLHWASHVLAVPLRCSCTNIMMPLCVEWRRNGYCFRTEFGDWWHRELLEAHLKADSPRERYFLRWHIHLVLWFFSTVCISSDSFNRSEGNELSCVQLV